MMSTAKFLEIKRLLSLLEVEFESRKAPKRRRGAVGARAPRAVPYQGVTVHQDIDISEGLLPPRDHNGT